MNICITGANGYIGNHLINFLNGLPENHSLLGISRYPLQCNIQSKITPSPSDLSSWTNIFNGFDTVVHLSGAIKEPSNATENSLYDINVLQAETVSKAAVAAGVKRLIYISSIAIYGNMSATPILQSSKPNPKTEYAKSKLIAEEKIQEIASKEEIELVIIRPPMVYGPNSKGSFKRVKKYMAKGYPIPFKNIKNLRSFIYIENLTSFIYSCISNEKLNNEVFNISDGEDISTSDLFKLAYELESKTAIEIPMPNILIKLILVAIRRERLYEQLFRSMQIDISYACHKTGWKPEFSVREGITESIRS